MGLRDLVNKGKCLIGLHDGEWRAASPTSCTYQRTCVRCAAQHTKVEHPWGDWRFITATACDQQRDCRRCGLAEQRVLHTYGAATFVADDRCDRQEVCSRCHDIRVLPPQHSMTAWRYVEDDDCRELQHCSRCRADGTLSRTEHRWGEWQHSQAHNADVRVCRRCGELQIQAQAPHAANGQTVVDPTPVETVLQPTDPALVGHWRHTDTMSSGGFSLVTDTHLVLQEGGRWRRWTHSVSGMGEQTSEPVGGTWRVADGQLCSRMDGGAEARMRYVLEGHTLFFPDNGAARIWERVR